MAVQQRAQGHLSLHRAGKAHFLYALLKDYHVYLVIRFSLFQSGK